MTFYGCIGDRVQL